MEHYKPGYALLLTIGIALCIICAVPAIVLDAFDFSDPFLSDLSGAFVMILIAFGVFFLVMARQQSMRTGTASLPRALPTCSALHPRFPFCPALPEADGRGRKAASSYCP